MDDERVYDKIVNLKIPLYLNVHIHVYVRIIIIIMEEKPFLSHSHFLIDLINVKSFKKCSFLFTEKKNELKRKKKKKGKK